MGPRLMLGVWSSPGAEQRMLDTVLDAAGASSVCSPSPRVPLALLLPVKQPAGVMLQGKDGCCV